MIQKLGIIERFYVISGEIRTGPFVMNIAEVIN